MTSAPLPTAAVTAPAATTRRPNLMVSAGARNEVARYPAASTENTPPEETGLSPRPCCR